MHRTSASLWSAVVAVAGLVAVASASTPPGASLSLSQSSLGYLNGVITPLATSVLKGLHLPEIKINKDGFDVHLFDIETHTYNPGTTVLELQEGEGVKLGFKNFYLHIHIHFDAKMTGFPYLSTAGTAEVYAHNANIEATIGVSDNNGGFKIASDNIKADVGKFDIKINDGIIGGLLNLLENLFQGQVKSAVDNAAQSAIQGVINNLAKQLQNVQLTFPMSSFGAAADFSLTANPTITEQYLGVDAVGAVVNTKSPVPPVTGVVPPSVPAFSSSAADHYVQVGLSTYFLESLAWVYTEAHQLQTIVPHTAIPSIFDYQLNTTDLSVFAPGLKTKYPNMWCQLAIGVSNATSVGSSSSAGVTASIPVQLAVQPVTYRGPITAFTIGCDLKAGVKLSIVESSPQKLGGNLTYISCPLKPISSNVGPVSVAGLSDLINYLFPHILLPLVNKELGAGFPLPSLDGLTLTDSEILLEDNAIIVASDFTLKLT